MNKLLAALLCLLPLGVPASTQTIFGAPTTSCADSGGQHANYTVAASGLTTFSCGTSGSASGVTNQVAQWGVPVFLPPGGFFQNNGVYVIGQAPASSGTLSVSATSGSVTATFSQITLLGTASDVGRYITICDGNCTTTTASTYKTCNITGSIDNKNATCTLSGTLSGTGAFANDHVWISGAVTGTASYSSVLSYVPANAYFYFPVNVISAATAAGVYYTQCAFVTVCTVFNNALTAGPPIHISSPTAFSVTGTGAWSQTAGSYLTVISITIPGGTMGANGALTVYARGICVSDSNAKLMGMAFGGQTAAINSVTTTAWMPFTRTISNIDSASLQQTFSSAASGSPNDSTATNTGYTQLTVNTAADATLVLQLRVATATDWVAYMNGTITANTAL